jgi:hypothetical protein
MNVNIHVGADPDNTLLNFTNNWWGTVEREEIEALVYDQNDATNRATVSYRPFLTETSGIKGVADINTDGRTDGYDLSILASTFGLSNGQTGYKSAADIYSDSRIDGFDLAVLGVHFGEYGRGGIMGKFQNVNTDSIFVSLTSDQQSVNIGDTVTYTFSIEGVPALHSFAGAFKYDESLELLEATNLGFLNTAEDFEVTKLQYNNSEEKHFQVGLARLGRSDTVYAEGNGEILSISFKVTKEVSSDVLIDIESLGLFSPNGVQYEIQETQISTSRESLADELPERFRLLQNYPNPFNPSTNIQFEMPKAGEVQLRVFDLLGREVASLVNGRIKAGIHTINFDASNLSSGIYIYRIETGAVISSKMMTLIK